MKFLKALILVFIASLLTTSCFEDNDDNLISASEINDFVWKGMNLYYLYKDEIPNLANDRFSSNGEYADYLNSFSTPEDLFESLIYQRETIDKFSSIVDDYIALEQLLSGVFTTNGMKYSLYLQPNSSDKVFGVVRMVLNNSDADIKGLKRGDIFDAINGIPLTSSNAIDLLSTQSYTLNLATYNSNGTPENTDDTIDPNSETIALNKLEYNENPIHKTNILDVGGKKVGYMMYNGFTSNYETQLNEAFGDFKANNVEHLVLDLRYNPGGSVNTAILLSSMITGQFTGDIFSTEQWNSEFQQAFENENPELLINRFTNNNKGATLNSLNLSKVYILATNRSASASELVINALDPYINVVHIGENTSGKYQGSITVYDSADFNRQGANPNHTYAMQPLILKTLNKIGNTDYINGLTPDMEANEFINNLGILGDPNETLLAIALNDIQNSTGRLSQTKFIQSDTFKQPKELPSFEPVFEGMYTDKKIPAGIIKRTFLE